MDYGHAKYLDVLQGQKATIAKALERLEHRTAEVRISFAGRKKGAMNLNVPFGMAHSRSPIIIATFLVQLEALYSIALGPSNIFTGSLPA